MRILRTLSISLYEVAMTTAAGCLVGAAALGIAFFFDVVTGSGFFDICPN